MEGNTEFQTSVVWLDQCSMFYSIYCRKVAVAKLPFRSSKKNVATATKQTSFTVETFLVWQQF